MSVVIKNIGFLRARSLFLRRRDVPPSQAACKCIVPKVVGKPLVQGGGEPRFRCPPSCARRWVAKGRSTKRRRSQKLATTAVSARSRIWWCCVVLRAVSNPLVPRHLFTGTAGASTKNLWCSGCLVACYCGECEERGGADDTIIRRIEGPRLNGPCSTAYTDPRC